jgi:rfaE bifunctional protein nucleotidyltransferase chain/domain
MTTQEKIKSKILTPESLSFKLSFWKFRDKKIVFTNGCFDLLHVGHVRYLRAARALGDALVVGLNSDQSVRDLKGPGRPINNERDRAEVLAALECVDLVTIFPDVRATRFVEMAAPAIYAKGGDYTSDTLNAEERAVLEKIGAKIHIIPFEKGYSTSGLLERLRIRPK